MSKEQQAKPNSIFILLSVLVLVIVALMFVGIAPSGTRSTFPSSLEDQAYILVKNHKWLARDRGGDGTVDCLRLLPAVTCSGTYQAPGATCCQKWFGSEARVMDESMVNDLSALLRLKTALQASHTSVLDPNEDGTADCVVSVHDLEHVHIAAGDGVCSAAGDGNFTDESRARFTEVLALEERIRSRIASDGLANE